MQIAESVRDNPRTGVASAHGVGKSWVAARIALWWLCCYPGSIVATTAPTFRQVERVLWQELRQAHKNARERLPGKLLQTSLTVDDGWYAFGFSTVDANRFQGLHAEHVLAVFDEAAGVAQEIWTAAEGILTSAHCRLLAIGNPTEADGPFYQMFREPGVSKIHISAYDIPNVQERRTVIPGLTTWEWVEDKRARWGESSPIFKSRVLGEFPGDADNSVIPLSWVEAAVERGRASADASGVTCVALDVADGGEDRSILAIRRGSAVELLDVSQDNPHSTMALVGIARARAGSARLTVDSIGVGAGVVSRLRELGADVSAFNAAEATPDTDASGEMRFANIRAAAWWGLRERLHPETGDKLELPDDDELVADLTAPRWAMTSSGRIKIESKDDIRKRLGRSTDRADAVVMAFYGSNDGAYDLTAFSSPASGASLPAASSGFSFGAWRR